MKSGIKPRQEIFCREYVVSLNGTDAAIRAGYSGRTAQVQSSRLLRNAMVQKRLAELKEQSIGRVKSDTQYEISADRVLREVAFLAFSNMQDYITVKENGDAFIDLSRMSRDQAAALAAFEVIELPSQNIIEAGIELPRECVKVKIKMHDKMGALEKLMKHLGLLKEKVEIAGMNELIAALHEGRARVARLREERERNTVLS